MLGTFVNSSNNINQFDKLQTLVYIYQFVNELEMMNYGVLRNKLSHKLTFINKVNKFNK